MTRGPAGSDESPEAWGVSEDLFCNWQVIDGHRADWELSEHSVNSALRSLARRELSIQNGPGTRVPKFRQVNAPIGSIQPFQFQKQRVEINRRRRNS
jgi:hypothetical protein